MTAATAPAAGRSAIAPAPPLRVELQVASVASGLLVLLDAHRLTGRLPLEVQVQLSRLRHVVKAAIQAQAGRPMPAPTPAPADPATALRAWIAEQPWAQPGPQGWVYLLCFRDPTTGEHRPLQGQGCRGQYAGHYWGWTEDLVRRIAQHRNPAWSGAVGWSRWPWRRGCRSSWPGVSIRPPGAGSGGSRTRARPIGATRCAGGPAAPSTQPSPSPRSSGSSGGSRDRPAAPPPRPWWRAGRAGGGHSGGRLGRSAVRPAPSPGQRAPPGPGPGQGAPSSPQATRPWPWWWEGVSGQGIGPDRTRLGRPPRRRSAVASGHRSARPRRHAPGRGGQRPHQPPQQPRSGPRRDQPLAARPTRHRLLLRPQPPQPGPPRPAGPNRPADRPCGDHRQRPRRPAPPPLPDPPNGGPPVSPDAVVRRWCR